MLNLAGFNSTIYSFNNKTWVSLTPITMCSILLDGKQGVAVEVILGRPVFSSFLTVNKKISRMKTRYPGNPADLHADVPEPDDQQLHRPVRHHGRPSQPYRHACPLNFVSICL